MHVNDDECVIHFAYLVNKPHSVAGISEDHAQGKKIQPNWKVQHWSTYVKSELPSLFKFKFKLTMHRFQLSSYISPF